MNLPNHHRYITQFGGRELVIETGKLAKQVSGSVTVRYGDTLVLVTAQMNDSASPVPFLPPRSSTRSATTPSARSRARSCAARVAPACRAR